MHGAGSVSIPCRGGGGGPTILEEGVMRMGDDETSPSGSRSSAELFGDFGLQWDEYETPYDPALLVDGDG
jgi:hypothetical protein